MEQNTKSHLNVSELAGMFGLNVQTLHYYDKIGILKPDFRDEKNGYRKYRFDQIYQLASIRYMRKLGYSIEDVRVYQDSRHTEDTIRHLRERSAAIHAQWEDMLRIDRAILRKIQFIEDSMALAEGKLDSVFTEQLPERRYIPIGTEDVLYMDESFYFYPTLAFYEENLKYFGALETETPEEKMPGTENVSAEEVTSGPEAVIPSGNYLIGYHCGPYEEIQKTYDRMRRARPDLTFAQLIVSVNIIDQFVEQDNKKFITRVEMRILEKASGAAAPLK